MPSRRKLAPTVVLLVVATAVLFVWSATLVLTSQGGLGALIATVVTLSFTAFSVPESIILARRQRLSPAAVIGSDGQDGAENQPQRRRVTAIGWIALALSIAAPALFVAMGSTFSDSLNYASQPDPPFGALIFPFVLLLWFADVLAAIVVCTIAGTRGRGNRIVGVAGGLIVAAPIGLIFSIL